MDRAHGAVREVLGGGEDGPQVRAARALAGDGMLSGSALITPCGRCRQILTEAAQLAGRDIDIYCGSADGDDFAHFRASELLPHAFGPADLGIR